MDAETFEFPDEDDWIVVPRWGEFQHYKRRRPPWIRVYARLLNNPDYIDLSLASKGLLQIIWLAYSQRDEQLSTRQLRHFVRPSLLGASQITSLNQAGFIRFSASKPLATKTETETETEEVSETPQTPLTHREAEREIRQRAVDFAADWQGGSSDDFEEALDQLERDLRARIPYGLRSKLWDEALKREHK